jgi:hypothetical protein
MIEGSCSSDFPQSCNGIFYKNFAIESYTFFRKLVAIQNFNTFFFVT